MNVKIILRIFLLCLVFIQITGVAGALSITEVGSYDTAGSAQSVAVSGKYAYVADDNNGLVIIDISNQAAPMLAGRYDTAGRAFDVTVSGNYAYVADGDDGLVIIDISNPTASALAGSYNTAGFARGVTVSGDYAYVADANNGLVIIDISNPAASALVGSYNTAEPALNVAVSGNYAYIADGDNGLVIIDISNQATPMLVGGSDSARWARGVTVSGDYAYVADANNGLVIIDVSNPAASALAGSYNTAGFAQDVAVSDNYAYVADWDNFIIIDLSNQAAPVLVGSYNVAGIVQSVTVSGNYAYVADRINGLVILDISGSISVSSNPSGANVYLDGAYKGTTPYTITSVSAGSHTIKLTKPGYVDTTKTVNIVGGGTASVSETLTLIPPSTGSISISSSPSGATAYLDGTYKGTTPYTITFVSTGSHTIKLTKTGYVDIVKTVNVVSGDTTSVSETLPPIPPSIGSISITSNPSGTSVYLDGPYKGTTPLTLNNLRIGTHSIKLTKDGYNDKTKSFTITKDNTEKISLLLDSSENSAVESTNLVDTTAPNTDNNKSDAVLVPLSNSDETSPNIFGNISYGSIGAILLLLFLMGIVVSSRNKSKPKRQSISAHKGNSATSAKSIDPPKITSAFGYKGATIQYKIKIENPTSEPMADIKVNFYVPDVFLASESTKSIVILKPSESKTVTFEIRPTGECGDCEVSGKVVYYDYSTKKTTEVEIPAKSLSIVCPMLKGKEISKPDWHGAITNLVKTEESTKDLDMPAKTLFEMTSRIVKDMNMHQLEPEITDSPQLFNGVARFYGEGVKGLKYAAQVEVVGGAKKSRLILKTWAEKEEALTGFYHGLLDEIEKRVSVKGYIDDSIVQNFYHNGDNIGTQVKDSIVQRSNIGTGAGDKKCSNCNTVVDASSEFCNKCGEKLKI